MKKLLALAVSLPLFIGCASVGKVMVAGLVETSTYMPGIIASESDLDSYLNVIRPVSGRVVSDQLGTFFHQDKGDRIHIALLRKDDDAVLRNAMTTSVGLMEPVYSYSPSGQIAPDWGATQARHKLLTQEMRLKLLPLEATRKFHERLPAFSASEAQRSSGAVGTMSVQLSGNGGMYNNQFAKAVLDAVPGDFQYIVVDAMTEQYFRHLSTGSTAGGTAHGAEVALMAVKTLRYQSMAFMTRAYLNNLQKGGTFRFHSRCYALDLPRMRSELRGTPPGALPPGKTVREELPKEIAAYDRARIESEQACKSAMQALQVAGAIASERLK